MSRTLRSVALVAVSPSSAIGTAGAAEQPREARVDYAYYSPPSLVLKRFGWLEKVYDDLVDPTWAKAAVR